MNSIPGKYIPVILILLALTGCISPKFSLFPDSRSPLKEYVLEGKNSKAKVLVIPVRGTISDAPEKGLIRSSPGMVRRIVSHLRKAEKDPKVKAVILKIDSPGGTVTGSDILYHEIMEFKKRTKVKLIVSMMNLAASGGYYISLPADLIMAHPTTIIGSIGVIYIRPEITGLMEKIGVRVNISKTGKAKDMGTYFRESTPEEEKLIQKMVTQLGERFFTLVKKHRNLDEKTMAEVSTAKVWLADEALEMGLIDRIAYINEAVEAAKSLTGLDKDAKVVIYRRAKYSDDNIYNTASTNFGGPSSLIDTGFTNALPNMDAGFYYLWPFAGAEN